MFTLDNEKQSWFGSPCISLCLFSWPMSSQGFRSAVWGAGVSLVTVTYTVAAADGWWSHHLKDSAQCNFNKERRRNTNFPVTWLFKRLCLKSATVDECGGLQDVSCLLGEEWDVMCWVSKWSSFATTVMHIKECQVVGHPTTLVGTEISQDILYSHSWSPEGELMRLLWCLDSSSEQTSYPVKYVNI